MGYLYHGSTKGFWLRSWMMTKRSVYTLDNWSMKQLKELAKELKIEKLSKYKKKYDLYLEIEKTIKETK